MRTLSIDIETYSDIDITKTGLYKYVRSPNFKILLFAYAWDYGPVQLIDLTKEELPESIVAALKDPEVLKTAYNAAFEINCLSRFYETEVRQWECTMVHGLYAGYPAGLGLVAKVMNMPEDKQKDRAGKALIKLFCVPRKPTKRDPRTRILPADEPEKWELFKEYCRQDVVTEMAIKQKLLPYPLPETEKTYWGEDQFINYYGARIDTELVHGAQTIADTEANRLTERIREITGLVNPNSPTQLKKWLEDQSGAPVKSLNKTDVPELIKLYDETGLDDAAEVLRIRQRAAKTSLKKYDAMEDAVCEDGRVRGLIQFYGTRTGRYAGRLVQVQNLPRNYLESLDEARSLVKAADLDAVRVFYTDVQDTVSQLIRTAFIPSEGRYFAVADYSAIEARVIAWLAGEDWRMKVFHGDGKIYEASASSMFHVPAEKIVKGNPEYSLRAKGKIAELALGYQGSKGALVTMGALRMGIPEEELPDIVSRWRKANPNIVSLWNQLDEAVIDTVKTFREHTIRGKITTSRDENYLFITLPSGRKLFYPGPVVDEGDFGGDQVKYEGLNQTTKKWEYVRMYGGKWTENVVQAIARDCLAEALHKLIQAGYLPVFHVHDEVILEIKNADAEHSLENAIAIMCQAPAWARDLPLNADGFTSSYYKKE